MAQVNLFHFGRKSIKFLAKNLFIEPIKKGLTIPLAFALICCPKNVESEFSIF